jgi:phospholipid-translocating ATPase
MSSNNNHFQSFGKYIEYFLVWMVIYNYIIPIALFVAIEVQKFISSSFFSWDLALYDVDRDLPAKCNTSGTRVIKLLSRL